MEDPYNPLTLCCFYQEEEIGELRQALMYTTMELETAILSANEEIARRDLELVRLKDVLSKTVKERDEAQMRCRKIILEKLVLEQQLQQKQQDSLRTYSIEDNDSKASDGFTTPNVEQLSMEKEELDFEVKKPLPEKGKLLKAVMEAGPLLQILLLAGQLPDWQHPPPQIHSIEIPPFAISSPKMPFMRQDSSKSVTSGSCLSKKSALQLSESPSSKHLKIVDALH